MSTSDTTTWTCSVDTSSGSAVASLAVSVNGGPASPFVIKGVCYSPCPIGGSNNNGPNIGDWFWDSYEVVPGVWITNWSGTWSNDLQTIATLGVNLIRVYCFLDTQLPQSPPRRRMCSRTSSFSMPATRPVST